MDGGDLGLELVGRPGARQQRKTLDGKVRVPERAVLVLQRDERTGSVLPGRRARMVQEHERQQSAYLGLGRHQVNQEPAQPKGLSGQQILPRVALVEDQVDHREHPGQPLVQLLRRGNPVRDTGVADLLLGPGDALGSGRGRDQEGRRDLLHLQSGHRAQGQRHAGLERQGRVTTREQQAQTIVRSSVLNRAGQQTQLGRLGDRAP
jgi:hypothetical protein